VGTVVRQRLQRVVVESNFGKPNRFESRVRMPAPEGPALSNVKTRKLW